MDGCHINLGCGSVFVSQSNWINLDFAPTSSEVRQANLLAKLPLADGSATVVYASHFLEHIPYADVPAFLAECWRVLEPDGVLRLVLPDLEEMCRAYLSLRECAEHDKADFLVFEIIDQCVRRESGGELGQLYHQLRHESTANAAMRDFVRYRTGEDLSASQPFPPTDLSGGGFFRAIHHALIWLARLPQRTRGRLLRTWLRFWVAALPSVFSAQNVSLAAVGERHHWLWDFYQLHQILKSVGFMSIERQTCLSSSIPGFPFYPLDVDRDGCPRKGAESMYVEARKLM